MSRLSHALFHVFVSSGLVLAAGAASAGTHGTPHVAVGAQYDTTHVYVAPDKVEAFVNSLIETFGGKTTPQAIATVTPTPSSSSIQLVFTPAGTFSVFGFRTPIPAPFGSERTGSDYRPGCSCPSRPRQQRRGGPGPAVGNTEL